MDGALVEEGEARAALDRVVGSSAFARSRRNRELLSHLVTETLSGRGDQLNGTTVGQDVLGKDASFDPANDPSVRVQMGRLRKLLETHYDADGADDPLRIVLPKGSYEPVFERVDDPARLASGAPPAGPASNPSERPAPDGDEAAVLDTAAPADGPPPRGSRPVLQGRWRLAAVAAIAIVVAASLATYAFSLRAPRLPNSAYPVVMVSEFDNRTGDVSNDVLAAGLQRQFAADLQRFRTARVTLQPESTPAAVPNMAARADFTITGSLLEAGSTLDAIVWLVDRRNASIVETERLTVSVGSDDYREALEEFSAQLSAHVAAPRGRLAAVSQRRFEDLPPLDGNRDMAAFRCWSMFNAFTVDRTEATFAPVHECLEREAAADPTDGTLLAALGWMELLGAPEANLLDTSALGTETSVTRAEGLVDQAIAVDPGNDVAHVYHGLINWFLGDQREALDSMRRAVRLNPADPQHRADYGMFLSYSGNWKDGLALVREAIEWDVSPPGWYFLPLFFDALRRNEPGAALRLLDDGAAAGDPFEPIYRLAAARMAGDADRVEQERAAVRAIADRHGGDVLSPLRPWLRSADLLGLLERELSAAGIPTG